MSFVYEFIMMLTESAGDLPADGSNGQVRDMDTHKSVSSIIKKFSRLSTAKKNYDERMRKADLDRVRTFSARKLQVAKRNHSHGHDAPSDTKGDDHQDGDRNDSWSGQVEMLEAEKLLLHFRVAECMTSDGSREREVSRQIFASPDKNNDECMQTAGCGHSGTTETCRRSDGRINVDGCERGSSGSSLSPPSLPPSPLLNTQPQTQTQTYTNTPLQGPQSRESILCDLSTAQDTKKSCVEELSIVIRGAERVLRDKGMKKAALNERLKVLSDMLHSEVVKRRPQVSWGGGGG